MAKGPDDPQGDDAGIGIVYGSERGLVPGARQLLPGPYRRRGRGGAARRLRHRGRL
ncbi:hypothetical protein ACW23B_14665 [Streptomyces albidoflavus]